MWFCEFERLKKAKLLGEPRFPTGMHDIAELRQYDPTAAFENLADPRAEAALFGR